MKNEELTERIQKSLTEKRENLYHWLEGTPTEEKQVALAEDDACVEEHLEVIEASLEAAAEGTLGFCEVCHGYVDDELLEMDYTAHVCLEHYSDEQRSQLEAELELSQVVQRALLPQQDPNIPGLEIAAFSRPSQIIGGDYFDFFRFQDGSHGLAIADVVGHGVSAAMLMSSLQTSLRTLVPGSSLAGEVLQRVNHFYLHNINLTTFITAFLARFEPATQRLTYSNAGHNPPLHFRAADGSLNWLNPTGPAIGLVEGYQLEEGETTLAKGDLLVLYTDGVTEAINPGREAFGEARLGALLEQNAGRSAQEILAAIRQLIQEFAQGQPIMDDTTVVVCKVTQ
jgi:sigma-B regulation protein RsbU (phosphoserine phosphatase)